MKKERNYIISIAAFILCLIGSINHSYAQCGSSSGVGGFQTLEEDFCGGEKKVWAGKSYSSVDLPPATDVYILVDWGYVGAGATEYYPTVFEFGNYVIDNTPANAPPPGALFANDRYAYHEYPTNLENCSYDVDVSLVFVDAGETPGGHPSTIICPGTSNSASTIYWEKDNILPGNLEIQDAPIIRICEGESVTINPLENVSNYNCPLTNNTTERWFQWIYNIDGGNPIPDVVINGPNLGGSQTFNVGGPASNLNFEEPVQLDPGPNLVTGDIDMDPTGTITIDGTSTVAGQYFDIQLNAWNVCNPFDDPDNPSTPSLTAAANADSIPEFTTIRILIVDEPILDPVEITDFSNNPKPGNLFCPEEPIRITNGGSDLGPGPWTINIYDGATTSDPLIASYPSQNIDLDTENTTGPDATALNTPGVKTVEVVKVNNSSDITGGCSSSITAQYEIIGTPSATIGFDDGTFGSPNTANNTYELCAESLPINLELTDETSGKTANLTTEWNIEKIAPTSFLVDNVDDGGGGVTPFPYPSNPLVISDTGHYRIELIVLDGSTNCTSTDQLDIYVYDTPEPLFTATGVCEGEDTDFDPSGSNIPTVINGEIIDQWLWDFSYDGTTFNTELTRTNDNVFTRNLGAAGDYDVALITRSDKGCYSDTIVTNVSIYANPDTDLQAFYGQDYEAFLEDDPYAGDPICPGTLIKFFNNSDEFNNDASVIDVDYYLEIDSLGTIITRNIGDSGSFLTPDIFDNQNATNEVYEIRLVAIANPTDGNADNNCLTTSAPIFVDVLPGSGSGFDVFESLSPDVSYNPPYCSPQEFFFRIDNTTNNRLNSNDSVVWTAKNGSTVLGGDTIIYSGGNREDYDFNFNFENDYPNVGPINYTVELQPYAQGVCISSSERTVTVRPKPISDFAPVDTVVTCDSVTYYFEAEQPGLLNYFWTASPVDNDAIADTLRAENNNGAEYWVSFGRPADTDPPLTINVTLLTENPFGCPSDPSGAYTTTIQPEDNFNIDLASAGSGNCLPNTYTFTNNTVPTDIPANTNWELHITNTTLASTTVIAGDTLPVGNQDFSLGYDYNFTQAANYEIRLIALLESTCDLTSDPPISLTFNNSPQMNFRPVQEEGCSPLELDIIDSSFNPDGTDLDVVSISWENLASGAIDDIIVNNEPANYFNSINPIATLLYTTDDGTGFNDYEITLSGENEFGCTNDSTYRVRVFQEPQIDFDITSTNPACEEDYTFEFEFTTSVFPAGTEFTWNWGDGQSLVTDQDTAVSHTFSNRLAFFGQDNYNVTLTAETSNNCIVTVGKTVTLNPRVDASFFKDRIEGCSPLSVNFTSTAIGTGLSGNHVYEKRIKGSGDPWGTIDSVENNGRVSELLENTSGSDIIYEIRYIAESSLGGCSDTSDIQEIIIFPEFSSPAITGTNEVCAFEQSVPYSVPLNPGSTYLWQMPLGAFISNQNADGNEIEVNFSNFSGTLQVQEINSNGCFGTPSTIPINVLSGPSATLSLNGSNVICPGDETSLRFDLNGPPGSTNFDVIYNNGQENDTLKNIQDGHIETVSPTNSTNYFLVDVTDLANPNCNPSGLTGSAFVNVNTPPSATMSGSTTICEGENTNLIINLTGIGPWNVVYTDGNNNFDINNTNNPVTIASVSPTSDTDYEIVSVTDNNTPVCSGTFSGTAEIKVNPKPTAEIFGNVNNVCQNDPTQIGVNLTGTAPWTVRYTDGTITYTISNITPDASYDPATDTYTHLFDVNPVSGTTTYTLTEVLDSSTPIPCSGDISGTATVMAYDRPEVEITGDTTLCMGQTTPLSFNFDGDGPFSGNYTANEDTLEFNNLQDGAEINVTPESNTIYRVVELFDTRGCPGLNLGGPVSINVNQLPTSEISGADTTCYGEQTNLIFDQTGVGPWTITYTDGSNNITFSTSFNRHFEPINPTKTTNYSLVSVTDSNNPNSCSGQVSGSVQKIVYPNLEASFEVDPQDMVLPESTINLTNNTTNKGEWNYFWEFGDGTTSEEADPAPHDYGTFGEFTVRLTATNGQCTDTYQTIVTIGAIPPIIDFDADPKEGCLPLVVQFENLSQYADPSTYQWEFGDGQRAAAVENPIHVYTNPGTYNVTLSATNITGQRTELVKEEFIIVNATPQASFTIPDEYRQVFTTEEVRFVNLSEGADEYIWKFGDGNESFEEEPVHAYPDSGVYDITLIAINSETGCTDSVRLSSQVKVILGGESEVPNAFTPSRAGPGTGSTNPLQNDFFLPRVEGVSQFNMKIYNRWGELLFESDSKDEGWDGYYNGVLMPQGVYVYRLELVYENGRRETKIGDITLIR